MQASSVHLLLSSNPNTHNSHPNTQLTASVEMAADVTTRGLDATTVATDGCPKPRHEKAANARYEGMLSFIARGCLQRDYVPCLVEPFLHELMESCPLLQLFRYV